MSNNIDLNHVAVFVEVVRAGSFTAAAAKLELPKATVSRRVAALEAALGVRLLNRTTRALSLTDPGRRYYDASLGGLAAIDGANRAARGDQDAPGGTVRVSLPAEDSFLAEAAAAFLERYPDIRLEFVLTDDRLDLIAEQIDVAFRGGELEDSSLIARKVAPGRRILCASPGYLDRVGRPRLLADLEGHDAVIHGRSLTNAIWVLDGPDGVGRVQVQGRLAANSVTFALRAARAGIGIAFLPDAVAAADLDAGRLERVLPDWETASGGLYVVYPSNRHQPAAVRAFVDFVMTEGLLEFPVPAAGRS